MRKRTGIVIGVLIVTALAFAFFVPLFLTCHPANFVLSCPPFGGCYLPHCIHSSGYVPKLGSMTYWLFGYGGTFVSNWPLWPTDYQVFFP
jgi:hypothetical protein